MDSKEGLDEKDRLIRDLKKEMGLIMLKKKQIVAYNKESASFEYIGEPLKLKHDEEDTPACTSIEEILEMTKAWLKKNDRITV